ncbi:hypothetical protein GCM10020295_12150 [Streptomyces cinereospinus]
MARLHVGGQPDGVVQGAAVHLEPGGAGQLGGDAVAQPRAGTAADGHGEPARVGYPLVGEDVGQVIEGTRADVHDDRRRDEPGQ